MIPNREIMAFSGGKRGTEKNGNEKRMEGDDGAEEQGLRSA